LQSQIKDLAEQLTNPDITPDEYAILSSEYVVLKRKISSMKNRTFTEEA
jgi:SMC interacting uncharacterized protein involved in chromosome segregation